jgi:hypothetical protein
MTVSAVAQGQARVAITVSDLPTVDVTTWSLWRSDGTTAVLVRGAIDRPADGETAVIYDREAPLNTPVMYYAEWIYIPTSTVVRDNSGFVTVLADRPLLSEPISGELAQVTIVVWPERSRTARASVLAVARRSNPIVISDLMGPASSSPVLRTDDVEQREALRLILESGLAVQLRATCVGVDDAYLAVQSWTMRRRSNNALDPVRFHDLTVIEIDQPNPQLEAIGDTLADLHAAEPGNLGDIADRWSTLLEIAQEDLSGGGL